MTDHDKLLRDMDKCIHWDLLVEHLKTFPPADQLKYVEALLNSYNREWK